MKMDEVLPISGKIEKAYVIYQLCLAWGSIKHAHEVIKTTSEIHDKLDAVNNASRAIAKAMIAGLLFRGLIGPFSYFVRSTSYDYKLYQELSPSASKGLAAIYVDMISDNLSKLIMSGIDVAADAIADTLDGKLDGLFEVLDQYYAYMNDSENFNDFCNKIFDFIDDIGLFDTVSDIFDYIGDAINFVDTLPETISGLPDTLLNFLDGLFNAFNIPESLRILFGQAKSFRPRIDPLALDLDGDGLETVGAGSGLVFDHNGIFFSHYVTQRQ